MVVFAHTPPPLHGQSTMVQLMLQGLGVAAVPNTTRAATPGSNQQPAPFQRWDGECYHINTRLSRDLEDVGHAQLHKGVLLINYCVRALWLRIARRADNFYFVPAAPIRASLYRDWLVMLLCRCFYRHTVFHWHAVGLGHWLDSEGRWWERRVSHLLMDRVDLAIVLSERNRSDAEKFRPRRVAIVPNGIPDPCPEYDATIRGLRTARLADRRRVVSGSAGSTAGRISVRVLFMAHCTREKGVFDAIEAVRLANQQLTKRQIPVALRLSVAGRFVDAKELAVFRSILQEPGAADWLDYMGFVESEAKAAALAGSDLFCFPTFYPCEGQPLNVMEAMAYGLPIATTRWRSIPELLPPNYPGLADPEHPDQVAKVLVALLTESGDLLRERFLNHFVLGKHLTRLAGALSQVDTS
jgi:glycosyltransferase involved in cell wall biosynthesis